MLLEDLRVDLAANESLALFGAYLFNHLDAAYLLLTDGRSDPTSNNNACISYVYACIDG
jgi:hypothetical protein